MKIKRYFAPNVREAIALVRNELGEDAIILSNKNVQGGVEIMAAADYDESLLNETIPEPVKKPVHKRAEPAAPALNTETENVTYAKPLVNKKSSGGIKTEKKPKSIPVTPRPETSKRLSETPEAKGPPKSQVVWTQDPVFTEMRQELKSLRSLVENQLSGFAWGEMIQRYPQRVKLLQQLTKLGLSTSICQRLLNEVSDIDDFEKLWLASLSKLSSWLPLNDDAIISGGGVVAMVGPTGVGKTTTIAKLAARYALRYGARHVALISMDNYRIGAHEQLRSYSRILDMPVRFPKGHNELCQALEEFSDKSLVLIDTAGMSQRDLRLNQQFSLLKSKVSITTYLVLSTTTRLSCLHETMDAFKSAKLDGCILTKLDEATSLGAALSEAIEHNLPIAYISDGQRVPEDLSVARAHNLINQAVSIMQQAGRILEEEAPGLTILNNGGIAAHV
ncbi:MAG TPA: flagellar biosynthesis protein FlhF [Gammaproteobacteria bacterium]|nr:flagellar biosynthesis protein FlhF [Gammaproteobacteria bacterium]